jgi:hypothetical protein
LLCEVAVGKPYEIDYPEYMEQPHEGFDSTKGRGTQAPSPDGTIITKKGYGVPLGTVTSTPGGMGYNEYIVYDVARVRIRYVVMCA